VAKNPSEDFEQEIYEAAVIPEQWPSVLGRLSREAGSVGAVLFSNTEKDRRWTASPSINARMEQFISEGWIGRNTRAERGFGKGLAGVPRFFTEDDLFGDEDYMSDPIYTEYFIPAGLGWSAGTAILLPHGDALTLSVERARAHGPFPAETLAVLDATRPHLARSAMFAARLSFERARTAIETLSALGLAACAVLDDGKTTVGNAEFEADATLWTTRGADRIALIDKRADRLLYDALAAISSDRGVRSIPAYAEGAHGPAVVHVVPIRRSAHDLFTRAAAILVVTRSADKPVGAPLLQALFDLSAIEAQIAARVASGMTAESIATADNKSEATVRNQLRSVLQKTGCQRQTDLVRLLARLIPAGM